MLSPYLPSIITVNIHKLKFSNQKTEWLNDKKMMQSHKRLTFKQKETHRPKGKGDGKTFGNGNQRE